ncbi:dirigent protein 22-like [Salvia divinorum]|uniref:Dirigent protein n=1 Tax=Salvia divinorum TaxID=28513 RepID=A0ABD1FRQ4_SALDI
MAPMKITLFLLLFLATFTYAKTKLGHHKEIEMTIYYHDYAGGPNATTIEIPRPSTGHLNYTRFGAMLCADDPITEGIEKDSVPIARGQVIYIISALDGSYAQILMSVVFINGKYKGSTIEIQGSYDQSLVTVPEAAVVGGTGKFRLAFGYATFEIVSYDSVTGYSLTRSNMTILHY